MLDKVSLQEQIRQSARDLVPAIRTRQNETAQLGRLPDATIDAMQEAGFFRIMQPKRFGGYELDPQDFFDVQQTLAEGCMSTAWVLGVVAIHNWQLGMFADQAQQDVWGDDDSVLISSSYMPVGKVEIVDGGYMLSGHWGFSSGSKHCQWAFLGAMIPSEGAPDYRTFLVPLGDYEIVDNWDVSGLEGTGSNDIVIREPVFVPEHRTHKSVDGFTGQNPGCAENTAPSFTLPFGQIFTRAVACSSIGALQGVVNNYVDVQKDRVGLNDGAKIAQDPNAQMALAEAIACIEECRAILKDDLDFFTHHANNGLELDINERIRRRFNASRISRKCADSVNELFIACGAQGIFRGHPLNRAWLDINAGRSHVANNPFKFGRNLGGTLLGLPNTDFFL
ncbi:Flavin-dependent monooxygenase, oxygenase subunit HsaA [BD1-7 clade bacterium]|uniref:Flavin-dependent monooxygenase, oxygenase subunit HsaA n=1 Tax=BD1-7 clade bacterium TaxID=2029982 RepID=A0A5S9QQZ9_9GAMM|nr:Flavin-dependent monooxygenase, oxygenase subunit HsaA [BD1-7 clade bacterium]CAA0121944.1 Flavin-dependent monooxygenase, oxygenase subunit HsaA [BD1-7 clade bacterium]